MADGVSAPENGEGADVVPLHPRTAPTAPERAKLAIVSTLKPSA
ncbi:hypothetical protein L332_02550 [Agrococcus pavilionensis RW1]|uniref:Uncharacterized protein n=1 Tax=Agrococcus pavilionensis RW1 TaxID=1330458 RepID=U1LM09_9MICO|nr:hypothetical protein [Agrococcus pavilionensis]ERG63334.1 hypothetical protein L332_02550 [Agrococcus pavilionensis RW1]